MDVFYGSTAFTTILAVSIQMRGGKIPGMEEGDIRRGFSTDSTNVFFFHSRRLIRGRGIRGEGEGGGAGSLGSGGLMTSPGRQRSVIHRCWRTCR